METRETMKPSFLVSTFLRGGALVALAQLLSALLLVFCTDKGLAGYCYGQWARSLTVYAAATLAESGVAAFLLHRYIKQN